MSEHRIQLSTIDLIMAVLKKNAYFSEPNAFETAMRVMNYFGYSDEIIDNALDTDDRKLFYFLQDLQILGTRWEEMQLLSGKNWRIFYWSLNVERMKRVMSASDKKKGDYDVYNSLPDSIWFVHDILQDV